MAYPHGITERIPSDKRLRSHLNIKSLEIVRFRGFCGIAPNQTADLLNAIPLLLHIV